VIFHPITPALLFYTGTPSFVSRLTWQQTRRKLEATSFSQNHADKN
jgi:hypothetical protein